MSGVSALSAARGSVASAMAAPNSSNSGSLDSLRVEVAVNDAIDSVWALRTSWYAGDDRPNLTDWWWRQLDCFAADWDDPRIINLLERMRDHCLPDATPFRAPAVIDRATDDSGVVNEILATEGRLLECRDAVLERRSDNLLIDMIHIERKRW
jgi:hypothetical protein